MRSARRIERVPLAVASAIASEGLLPKLPEEIDARDRLPGWRSPTLEEYATLEWWFVWEGEPFEKARMQRPVGVMTTREIYDWPSGCDCLEVVHVAGTPRAVVELIRFAGVRARRAKRRIMGSVGAHNLLMRRALETSHFVGYRIVYGTDQRYV